MRRGARYREGGTTALDLVKILGDSFANVFRN